MQMFSSLAHIKAINLGTCNVLFVHIKRIQIDDGTAWEGGIFHFPGRSLLTLNAIEQSLQGLGSMAIFSVFWPTKGLPWKAAGMKHEYWISLNILPFSSNNSNNKKKAPSYQKPEFL